MIPDAERAAAYDAPEVKITFTGGRAMVAQQISRGFNGSLQVGERGAGRV